MSQPPHQQHQHVMTSNQHNISTPSYFPLSDYRLNILKVNAALTHFLVVASDISLDLCNLNDKDKAPTKDNGTKGHGHCEICGSCSCRNWSHLDTSNKFDLLWFLREQVTRSLRRGRSFEIIPGKVGL